MNISDLQFPSQSFVVSRPRPCQVGDLQSLPKSPVTPPSSIPRWVTKISGGRKRRYTQWNVVSSVSIHVLYCDHITLLCSFAAGRSSGTVEVEVYVSQVIWFPLAKISGLSRVRQHIARTDRKKVALWMRGSGVSGLSSRSPSHKSIYLADRFLTLLRSAEGWHVPAGRKRIFIYKVRQTKTIIFFSFCFLEGFIHLGISKLPLGVFVLFYSRKCISKIYCSPHCWQQQRWHGTPQANMQSRSPRLQLTGLIKSAPIHGRNIRDLRWNALTGRIWTESGRIRMPQVWTMRTRPRLVKFSQMKCWFLPAWKVVSLVSRSRIRIRFRHDLLTGYL